MKNRTRHTGTLEIVKREPSSKFGNPRYCFRIDGYTAYTAPDSSHGYSLPNHDGKQITVILGTHYGKLTLDAIEQTA